MSRKRRAGIIAAGVAVVVLILLFAVVIPALTPPLPPEVTPEPELVTLDCTDRTSTSLQARGEVEDTCIGPLWLRGFVYTEGVEGVSGPAVIPLANPYFERAIPLQGWTIYDGIGERSSERAKLGTYSLEQDVPENARARVWQFVSLDISAGDHFTLGAWVWCDTPNGAQLQLYEADVINVRSAFHPGDSQWHFLTVTGIAAQDANRLRVILSPSRTTGPAYLACYDGIVLLRGGVVFEHGQFSEGTYSLTIDNLEPDTSYRIRALGANETGAGYGDVVHCVAPEPAMITRACTDPTENSLRAQGEVEDIGLGPLSTRGFVYAEGVEGAPGPAVIPLDNPSFGRAEALAGWAIVDELGERSSERAKLGTYSLKQDVPQDARARVWQYVSLDISEGERCTLGAWVWCDTPSGARIQIYEADVITVSSAFHPGDSQWHFLTVTGTAAQDASRLRVILSPWRAERSAYVAYYDGVVLLRGSAVFEHGQFSEGTYSLTIENLEPDISYSIRAFGQNDAGVGYGNVVTCQTLAGA